MRQGIAGGGLWACAVCVILVACGGGGDSEVQVADNSVVPIAGLWQGEDIRFRVSADSKSVSDYECSSERSSPSMESSDTVVVSEWAVMYGPPEGISVNSGTFTWNNPVQSIRGTFVSPSNAIVHVENYVPTVWARDYTVSFQAP